MKLTYQIYYHDTQVYNLNPSDFGNHFLWAYTDFIQEGISEKDRDHGGKKRPSPFRENVSVNVQGVGTVNGAAETLSANLAQQ